MSKLTCSFRYKLQVNTGFCHLGSCTACSFSGHASFLAKEAASLLNTCTPNCGGKRKGRGWFWKERCVLWETVFQELLLNEYIIQLTVHIYCIACLSLNIKEAEYAKIEHIPMVASTAASTKQLTDFLVHWKFQYIGDLTTVTLLMDYHRQKPHLWKR